METRYVNPKLWEKIEQLNLELIYDRMVIKHGWTAQRTEEAIKGYRQYLYMSQMFEQPLSPTGDVDAIWHEHILHTNKYQLDCQKLFGGFLHHFPTPAKWAQQQKNTCVGGSCEGSCSNDSCDSGTTNCGNSCASDCSKRSDNFAVIDFDNPVMEGRPVPAHFADTVKNFFY